MIFRRKQQRAGISSDVKHRLNSWVRTTKKNWLISNMIPIITVCCIYKIHVPHTRILARYNSPARGRARRMQCCIKWRQERDREIWNAYGIWWRNRKKPATKLIRTTKTLLFFFQFFFILTFHSITSRPHSVHLKFDNAMRIVVRCFDWAVYQMHIKNVWVFFLSIWSIHFGVFFLCSLSEIYSSHEMKRRKKNKFEYYVLFMQLNVHNWGAEKKIMSIDIRQNTCIIVNCTMHTRSRYVPFVIQFTNWYCILNEMLHVQTLIN